MRLAALLPAFLAGSVLSVSALAGPVDCPALLKSVEALLTKAETGEKEKAGATLWQARLSLRDALKLPGAAPECWTAAARLAVAANDAELATFAAEALAKSADATLLKSLEPLTDAELLSAIPKERETFSADLKKAEAGDAAAMTRLGDAYSQGRGVPNDDEFGVEWYTKAVAKDDATAMIRLGQRKMAGRGTDEDEKGGFELFRKAAEKGDATAMQIVGACYLKGAGVKTDLKEAFTWSLRSAEKGDSTAMLAVGTFYFAGQGTERDNAKGLEWTTKAAEKGDGEAMSMLGSIYYQGVVVPKDHKAAASWHARAIESDDQQAVSISSYWLGMMNLMGEGVEKNPAKGAKLLTLSHSLNNTSAGYPLAMCYMRGDGVEKDPAKGAALYAEMVTYHSGAMLALGACYLSGNGVEKNHAKAKELLEKALANGKEEARELLKLVKP